MTTNPLPAVEAAGEKDSRPSTAPTFFGRLPWTVWVVALFAAVVHIAPFWRAQLSQRDGWTFEDNLTLSPDQMQYRIWLRQSQREGPLITNRFTTEPNRPHLPVFFFWAVGKGGELVGTTPDRAYAYTGSILAVFLVVLVFATVRRFIPNARHAWWVVVPLLFGGGLGGHIKLLAQVPGLGQSKTFERLFVVPMANFPPFEDYRSHFLVKVFLDTHSIAVWIVGLGAVVAFWFAVERSTWPRIIGAASLFALMTILHVYEGVTLLAIAACVALCCWPLLADRRRVVMLVAVCTLAVAACYAVLVALYARSGLPLPDWRAVNILLTTLVMAYPISWALLAWGGVGYARRGGLDARFILGWILGCTIVTLSGPFFPYPDRGTLTMQVPLAIAAGMIFFARWSSVSARQALVLVLVCGATPLWLAARTWYFSGFRTDAPFQFVNASHRAARTAFLSAADTSQIFLADPPDLLWLAPRFPGRLYIGHFFLTVDFASKVSELRAALADPALMPAMLTKSRADLLFVNAAHDPQRFLAVPGLVPLAREDVGWVFRVTR